MKRFINQSHIKILPLFIGLIKSGLRAPISIWRFSINYLFTRSVCLSLSLTTRTFTRCEFVMAVIDHHHRRIRNKKYDNLSECHTSSVLIWAFTIFLLPPFRSYADFRTNSTTINNRANDDYCNLSCEEEGKGRDISQEIDLPEGHKPNFIISLGLIINSQIDLNTRNRHRKGDCIDLIALN